jgi:hypothetical protein
MALKPSLLATLVYFASSTAGMADTLHAIADGAFQHHGSSWIFPRQIGGFVRIGAPQDVDGTIDVVAHYAKVEGSTRTTAVVSVYPPESAAAETTLASAKAAIESTLKLAKQEAVRSEAPFKVGKQPEWVGVKASYKADAAVGSLANLYFFDTGAWIVKIRGGTEKADNNSDGLLDDFVRGQLWESLELTDESCTGRVCKAE